LEEEEVSTADEETDDEELVEVHVMWDFILPLLDNEEEEALPINIRNKSSTDSLKSSKIQKP